MTLRQHVARRLVAAVMKHEGEGLAMRPGNPLMLPKTWFREDECPRRPRVNDGDVNEETLTAPSAARTTVFQVAMGNCLEEHSRA